MRYQLSNALSHVSITILDQKFHSAGQKKTGFEDVLSGGRNMYIQNISDIECALVGVSISIIIFFISCLALSELEATLGQ